MSLRNLPKIEIPSTLPRGLEFCVHPGVMVRWGGSNHAPIDNVDDPRLARRVYEAVLAKSGVPRAERRRLLRELMAGIHDVPAPPPRVAVDPSVVRDLINALRS